MIVNESCHPRVTEIATKNIRFPMIKHQAFGIYRGPNLLLPVAADLIYSLSVAPATNPYRSTSSAPPLALARRRFEPASSLNVSNVDNYCNFLYRKHILPFSSNY